MISVRVLCKDKDRERMNSDRQDVFWHPNLPPFFPCPGERGRELGARARKAGAEVSRLSEASLRYDFMVLGWYQRSLTLASRSRDEITVWNLDTGTLTRTLTGNQGSVTAR